MSFGSKREIVSPGSSENVGEKERCIAVTLSARGVKKDNRAARFKFSNISITTCILLFVATGKFSHNADESRECRHEHNLT